MPLLFDTQGPAFPEHTSTHATYVTCVTRGFLTPHPSGQHPIPSLLISALEEFSFFSLKDTALCGIEGDGAHVAAAWGPLEHGLRTCEVSTGGIECYGSPTPSHLCWKLRPKPGLPLSEQGE